MAERHRNTVVGAFALTGIAVMVALVVMFGGGRRLFASTYYLSVVFPDGVVGVQEGQRVTLHGKRVGETREVVFVDEKDLSLGVRVLVEIDNEFELPAASEVVVAASIMGFGRPAIRIEVVEPGRQERLPRDGSAVLVGRMIPTLDQVLPKEMQRTLEDATQDIGRLAAAMTPVAAEIRRLLEARDISQVDVQKITANLDTLIQRFDGTLRSVNRILADPENQENVKAVLANARRMAENGAAFSEELAAVGRPGRELIEDGRVLLGKLTVASDELTSVLRNLDRTLGGINEGQGTAGLFLRDNRLYEEMVLSSRRLTKSLDELREVLDMAKKGQLKLKMF